MKIRMKATTSSESIAGVLSMAGFLLSLVFMPGGRHEKLD
jgi:hypothetical protein